MKRPIPQTVKRIVNVLIKHSKKYIVVLVGILLWIVGGLLLGIVGALTTFFVKTLVKRLQKDSSLEASIENPFIKNNCNKSSEETTDEPFEGSLLVAALGVYCTGNADFAGIQMHKRFSGEYSADWATLCRIASRSESLNGDLIVECLAATLLKNTVHDAAYDAHLVSIFSFLSVVEYDWNMERGVKPSEYLAELLHKPMYIDSTNEKEMEKAYLLLGVSANSDLDLVKSAHRSLVAMYHPDTLAGLSEEQKKIAAEAFLRIQSAYERILETY